MNILITGATGFIGRRLIHEIVKKYDPKDITCLIRDKENELEISGRKIISSYKIKTIKIDLSTGKGLDKAPQSPDVIIHMAANTETSETNHDINDQGTIKLYNALGKLTSKTHFIFISTTALMSGRDNCHKPFNEKTDPKPTDEYGRTKVRAEKFLIEKSQKDGFALTILRLGTVFGSGVRNDSLFDYMKKLINKNSPLARLNWPGLTSLVSAEDVARAIVMLIKKPPISGKYEIYILSAHSLTLAQISQQIHQTLGKNYKPITIPYVIWDLSKRMRFLVPFFENKIPPSIYNKIWRASLVVDNVIYPDPKKINKKLPTWKPKTLDKSIKEIVS